LKLSYPRSSIIKTVEKTKESPEGTHPIGALLIWNEDFTYIADSKTQQNQDFAANPKPEVQP
jgi:hypothetical protein